MKPEEIKIVRNDYGVFANAKVFVGGKSEMVTIWGKPGYYADEYRAKSDAEIQQIALDDWRSFAASSLGSITSAAKKASSAANGKKGGRPRKAQ